MSIDFSSLIDVKIAIILWCLGWFVKHSKITCIKRLPNDSIPIILMAAGVLLSCFMVGDVTLNAVIIGVVTGVFAVGVHSSGKNIFKLSENTTVYASQDSISNNLAKQEKEKIESGSSISDMYGGGVGIDLSSDYASDVSDFDSLGAGEEIIGGGNAVG